MYDKGVTSVTVTVTQSHNTEKVVEDFGIDNIIEYSNNMLALWKVHKL